MSPRIKRIIWILIVALIIAVVLFGLWFWYIGQQQAGQEGGGGSTVNATSNVSAGQNQNTASGNNPFGPFTSLFDTVSGWIPHGSNSNGPVAQNGGYGAGQYTYPVYNGNGTGTGTNVPPPATTTPPTLGNLCTPSCSCGTDGTQTCTDGNQNTDGSCHTTTQTCAQGSACLQCSGGGGNPATTTPVGSPWIPGGGAPFNPTPINGVSSSSPTGSGNIFNPVIGTGGNGGGGSGIVNTLVDAGITAAACSGIVAEEAKAVAAGKAAQAQIATQEGLNTAQSVSVADKPVETAAGYAAGNAAQSGIQSASNQINSFQSCMARYLARSLMDHITASTVNWINSGFHGSPTFVQDYQQLFANAANQAAGTYLQSSNFSFLCSPFALQVKIAVAQSYATNQAPPSSTNSCTLQSATSNITNFLHGDFSAGGWPALVSLTDAPLNNPFGAYIQLSSGLQGAISQADQKLAQSISPEGFLSIYQVNSCANQQQGTQSGNVGTVCPANCNCTITTPGTVISNELSKTLGLPLDQLNAAQDFDQILGALMSQLLQTALQEGVSNLSGSSPSSGGGPQQGAQLAQQLLSQMQNDTIVAQQYGYVEQGSIQDIQNTQGQLQTLANCWNSAATSTTFTSAQQAQAVANASSTEGQIASLQEQVDAANNQITVANSAIALLQQLQSQVLSANSLSDVQAVQTTYTTDQSNGSLITTDALTTAQQNRTTLQAQLATVNQNTSTQLQQCYAFGT